MESNQKPGSSNKTKQMDDIQKNEPYSATNCFSKMAFLESERLLRNGEVRARLKFSEFLKNTREEIVRDHPAANLEKLRMLEKYQIGETLKRREEVKSIEKTMREFDERTHKHWSTKLNKKS